MSSPIDFPGRTSCCCTEGGSMVLWPSRKSIASQHYDRNVNRPIYSFSATCTLLRYNKILCPAQRKPPHSCARTKVTDKEWKKNTNTQFWTSSDFSHPHVMQFSEKKALLLWGCWWVFCTIIWHPALHKCPQNQRWYVIFHVIFQ